ncbi:MAG: hypothetical protein KDC88_00825 [Ignavibacteriae bacterium]|nr:hypothetical protein [Ignavibacteriota bacterium]
MLKRIRAIFQIILLVIISIATSVCQTNNKTTALWLFDEQIGFYPSHVLEDFSDNNIPLVLGLGGQIVEGKFGNSLDPINQERISLPKGEEEFGLKKMSIPAGRTIEPLSWHNAKFAAFMTSGENHLRKEIGFRKPTTTKLNLGDFDWTVDFWFYPYRKTFEEGVLFEIGTGPRGENNYITSISLEHDLTNFKLVNYASDNIIRLQTNLSMNEWQHVAFVYDSRSNSLSHFINGKKLSTVQNIRLKELDIGDEDYMSIGRDCKWQKQFQGKIDELRFTEGMLYNSNFIPSQSLSPYTNITQKDSLIKGPILLAENRNNTFDIGSRKHLFIDNLLIEKCESIKFVVNPPRKGEVVISDIEGQFRKHLTVVEDEKGKIRIYNSAEKDYLEVFISDDGINFTRPNLGNQIKGNNNYCILEPVGGLGNPFIDPNSEGEGKWKYITGYHSRGTYLYTSPDGFVWKRMKLALIPFRNGTQSCTFYDDQRQLYVSYHRTGIHHTPGLATERASVVTQTNNLLSPIIYKPLSQSEYINIDKKERIRDPLPWWLDNGPLTPGDWGKEFPVKFKPDVEDPIGTDLYITKAIKYPWAPDTYFAFPIVYFHYYNDGPITRHELENPKRERGSGPIETQIAVSRNGLDWNRFYRPAYVGIGKHENYDMKTAYIAQGMIKRGNEIWQYYFGEPHYHSAHVKYDDKRAVFRLIQRIDGFISIDSPYSTEAIIITKPLLFKGNRLMINIDTEATGYAQIGFLDTNNNPIRGFEIDNCVYINGDFIETEVEWIRTSDGNSNYEHDNYENLESFNNIITSSDVSSLEGKEVKIIFRMKGSKLYAMQFKNKLD